jgi:hypothetical protein
VYWSVTDAAFARVIDVATWYGRLNMPAGNERVYFPMRSALETGGWSATSSRKAPTDVKTFFPEHPPLEPANENARAPAFGASVTFTRSLLSVKRGYPSAARSSSSSSRVAGDRSLMPWGFWGCSWGCAAGGPGTTREVPSSVDARASLIGCEVAEPRSRSKSASRAGIRSGPTSHVRPFGSAIRVAGIARGTAS